MATNSPLNTTAGLRLLGIWAHPDDEAYLSAGLMAKTVADGGTVTLVTLTDGELGFPAEDPRSPDVRATHRRAELRQAMATIGVDDIRFLGIADGHVADAPEHETVSVLADIIVQTQPDVIVTFGPEGVTGHEDHIANSRLVTAAWLRDRVGQLFYAAKTSAWLNEWSDVHAELGVLMAEESTVGGNDHVDHTLHLAGDDLALKREVLAGHASQTSAVAAFFGEDDYLQWICEESFRRPSSAELAAASHRELIAR